MEYSRELEDKIARIRERPNFVPLDEVETGQFYWFDVVGKDGVLRKYSGIAVRLNGVLYVCSSLDPKKADVIHQPDERTLGAQRMSRFAQKISIARMYDQVGNDEMAYKTWREAQDMLTPAQHDERKIRRAQLLGDYNYPEWVPKHVKAAMLKAMHDAEEALEAEIEAENAKDPAWDPDAETNAEPTLFDRALVVLGLQRIKED